MNEQEQEQMQKVLEFAKQYIARGWKIVPLRYKEKRAFIEGWQNLRIAENELEKYFLENGQAHNIGLLLGEPSNWLVDVDLDHAFAVEVAPVFLENTGVVFGRKSKKASHWLYYSTNARTTKFMIPARLAKQITGNAEDTTIIEIRSTGAQTMAPPSIHPDNEQVEWFAFGEPATVEYEKDRKDCKRYSFSPCMAEGHKTRHRNGTCRSAFKERLERGGNRKIYTGGCRPCRRRRDERPPESCRVHRKKDRSKSNDRLETPERAFGRGSREVGNRVVASGERKRGNGRN